MGFIRSILGITAVVAIVAAIAGTQLMPPISIPPMLQPTVNSLFDLGKVDFVHYDLTPDRTDKLRLRAVVANGNAVPVEGIEVRCALLDKKGRTVDDETFQLDQRIAPGAQREINATVSSHPRGEWTNAQCFVTAAAPVQKPSRAS
jgi:hypothetical protein